MDAIYTRKLRQNFLLLVLTSCLVLLCYHFIDVPVAWAVYNSHANKTVWFLRATWIAKGIAVAAPCALVAYAVLAVAYGKTKWLNVIAHSALAVIVTSVFKSGLKNIFGRYWPLTWHQNNPSLISNHAYGFNWLHSQGINQSFPSGHTAVTLAAVTVLWTAYPRLWPIWLAIALAVPISLIGMNFHFVSDTLAGAALGIMIANYFRQKSSDFGSL